MNQEANRVTHEISWEMFDRDLPGVYIVVLVVFFFVVWGVGAVGELPKDLDVGHKWRCKLCVFLGARINMY